MGRGFFLSGSVGPDGREVIDEFVGDLADPEAFMWERVWLSQLPSVGRRMFLAETPERKREIVDGFRKTALGLCRCPFLHGSVGRCDCPEGV